jgi:hypothetical protein
MVPPKSVDDLLRQTPRGNRRASVESKDPPKTPPFIPTSEEVGAWHRDQPAELAETDAVEAFIGSPKRWSLIEPYRPKLVVRAVFRWKGQDDSRAKVELIEVADPLDAIGMVLAHVRSTDPIKGGHLTRAEDEQGTHFYTWAGRYFAHVETPSADEGLAENCQRLLQKIVFQIPAADPPAWLKLLVTDKWVQGRLAVTRSVKTLARDVEAEWPVPQPDQLDALLGLNGTATLGVAAYEVMADEPLNYVWLVQYASADDARVAYDRYRAFLKTDADRGIMNTLLSEPRGPFLAGTWTAEQDSIGNNLAGLTAALPN